MTRNFTLYKSGDDSLIAELSESQLDGLIHCQPESENKRSIFGLQVEGRILTGIIVAAEGETAVVHTAANSPGGCTMKTQDGVSIKVGDDWTELKTKDADIARLLGLMNASLVPA